MYKINLWNAYACPDIIYTIIMYNYAAETRYTIHMRSLAAGNYVAFIV